MIQRQILATTPVRRKRPDPVRRILEPVAQQALEFHQLDRRLEHLRVRHPARFRRLLASLAETGQQTPVIVIRHQQRYLVIDGHQRIAALQLLKRDAVDAVIWDMNESEALLLIRSLRIHGEPETALEQGWLLAEMEERLGYSIADLARSFDRSTSWVSRRLALVDTLPEAVQQQVRDGCIAAQIAMRYLAPVARIDREQCVRMAQIFSKQLWTTRQAALLYNAWRDARTRQTRERILAAPELFLKTAQQQQQPAASTTLESDLNQVAAILRRALDRPQDAGNDAVIGNKIQHAMRLLQQLEEQHAEPIATHNDPGTTRERPEQARDRETAEPLAPERTQGSASELHRGAEDRTRRESRATPPTDPRVIAHVQRQSRASP